MSLMPEVPVLAGPLCTLRPLHVSDATELQRHADDVEVWRNLFEGFPRPYTLDDALTWCGIGSRQPSVGHVWGIAVGAGAGDGYGGAVVGCVGLRPDAGWLRCNAEVGYWIGRSHWRRGIGSQALLRVTEWAWAQQPELTRLYAPVFAWNLGSMGVARRCGYVKEGELPQSAIKDGRVIDRVLYATYRRSRPP